QLRSDEFWDDLKIVINILQPIVSTLKAFEANNSTISTTYSRFNTILTEVQKVECNYAAEIQQKIQYRWNYIYHPIMTIAFLLDPNYFEESKKNDNESACLSTFANFISSKYPNEDASRIYAELLKFRNKQMPYNNELIWNSAAHIDPSTWWSSWPLSELQKLAIQQIIESNENEIIDLVLNNEIENYENTENAHILPVSGTLPRPTFKNFAIWLFKTTIWSLVFGYLAFSVILSSIHLFEYLDFGVNRSRKFILPINRTYDTNNTSPLSEMTNEYRFLKLHSESSQLSRDNIFPFYFRSELTPEENDITVTTFVTQDNYDDLVRLAEAWQGPISAVFHLQNETLNSLEIINVLQTFANLY
ncbi:22087_t:CDS:2, partial [Gigaspora rosea]